MQIVLCRCLRMAASLGYNYVHLLHWCVEVFKQLCDSLFRCVRLSTRSTGSFSFTELAQSVRPRQAEKIACLHAVHASHRRFTMGTWNFANPASVVGTLGAHQPDSGERYNTVQYIALTEAEAQLERHAACFSLVC